MYMCIQICFILDTAAIRNGYMLLFVNPVRLQCLPREFLLDITAERGKRVTKHPYPQIPPHSLPSNIYYMIYLFVTQSQKRERKQKDTI